MNILNVSNTPKCDTVLVLGGGPSTFLNKKWVKGYCKKVNPIVISPHYEHYVKPVFIYFNSMRHLVQEINRFSCPNVVCPVSMLGPISKNKNLKKKRYFYVPFKKTAEKYAYMNIDHINLEDDGSINHSLINAGFTSILTSLFFKPKKVILIGFDGPVRDEDGYYLYYIRWNQEIRELPRAEDAVNEERSREERYWRMLLGYVASHGIELCTVRTDMLRGINRKKMGIRVLR